MKIEALRSEFKVFYVDRDFQNSHSFSESIKAIGYQAHFYPTSESALVAVQTHIPHIVIFNYVLNDPEADQFLAQIAKISSETQIILLASEGQLLKVLAKVSCGVIYDYLMTPVLSANELLVKIDRAALKLFLGFENEQLRQRRGFEENQVSKLGFEEDDQALDDAMLECLQRHLSELGQLKNPEQLMQKHILGVSQSAGNMPVLYFRFLPQQMSFVHHHSIWLQQEQMRNLGFQTGSLDHETMICLRERPKEFKPLRDFVEKVFQIAEFESFTLTHQGDLKGLVLLLNKVTSRKTLARLKLYHLFFENLFSANEFRKENHALQRLDASTGLLNRKSFDEKLKEEVSRARRTQNPLAMMILEMDNYQSLVQEYGDTNMQLLVKALGKSIKKNFRTIDVLARTNLNEFSFLLPHTTLQNAALKGEKMRRAYAASQFPFVKAEKRHLLSISIGVSEYPSLSSDAESLFRSTDEALQKVKKMHGNRVLTWQVEPGFTPDFAPHLAPDLAPGFSQKHSPKASAGRQEKLSD